MRAFCAQIRAIRAAFGFRMRNLSMRNNCGYLAGRLAAAEFTRAADQLPAKVKSVPRIPIAATAAAPESPTLAGNS